jgi:dTDP-4-amino-4,6-dideoxygalactose transaminase
VRVEPVSERAWRAQEDAAPAVPVCKPKLPAADRLLPYLREIDASRWYSNHGPLSRRFEARLAEHAAAASGDDVVVVSNATAALTAALLALDVAPGSLCMMPAWTFAASAHAVLNAGLIPWFVDVGAENGELAPQAAQHHAAAAPGRLGAVLAVSVFGRPVDAHAWDAFRRRTGVPVVIDAAAGFDVVRASPVPTVVSLHATKVLGVGEGAFLVCADTAHVHAVRERINFGFTDTREARVAAANAKLSEYAAAVGLAALDEWPSARAAFERVAREYRAAFENAAQIRLQAGYGTQWVSATAIVELPPSRLAAAEDALAAAGFGTRRWWGAGLARHRAFASCPRSALPVTESLAAATLGLPCSADLAAPAIRRIAQTCIVACA